MSHFYPDLDPPEGFEPYRPPGAPDWPPMFINKDGYITVMVQHPTPFMLGCGQGLGCLSLIVLPLMLGMLVAFISPDVGGFLICFGWFVGAIVAGFGFKYFGPWIGSRLSGKNGATFSREAVVLATGKEQIIRQRHPEVTIGFRAVELPDIAARSVGKNEAYRADLALQRRVEMVYGNEIVLITTMVNNTAAGQFAAALNLAYELSSKPFKQPTAPSPQGKDSPPDPRDMPI